MGGLSASLSFSSGSPRSALISLLNLNQRPRSLAMLSTPFRTASLLGEKWPELEWARQRASRRPSPHHFNTSINLPRCFSRTRMPENSNTEFKPIRRCLHHPLHNTPEPTTLHNPVCFFYTSLPLLSSAFSVLLAGSFCLTIHALMVLSVRACVRGLAAAMLHCLCGLRCLGSELNVNGAGG